MSSEIYEYRCTRHKEIGTNLRCGRCGDLICPKCLIQSPVGSRCPECSKIGQPNILKASKFELFKVLIAGILLSIIGGVLLGIISRILWATPIGYQFGSILTAITLSLFGVLIGEIIRRIGKYKIDRRIKVVAGLTIFGIYIIGFIFGNLLGVYSVLFTNIVTFIGVAFGIYIAMNRLRP